jgi:predicted nucleic acid-binding Zn ribbon protein
MQNVCLECGEPLVGRIDKKFCSDQCRNTYNNRKKRDVNNYMRRVDGILKKNRRILDSLVPGDKHTVHKEMLTKQGFDFDYFTNIYTTKTGKVYYFCYEMGYLPLGNDFYAVVRRSEQKKNEK